MHKVYFWLSWGGVKREDNREIQRNCSRARDYLTEAACKLQYEKQVNLKAFY